MFVCLYSKAKIKIILNQTRNLKEFFSDAVIHDKPSNTIPV